MGLAAAPVGQALASEPQVVVAVADAGDASLKLLDSAEKSQDHAAELARGSRATLERHWISRTSKAVSALAFQNPSGSGARSRHGSLPPVRLLWSGER